MVSCAMLAASSGPAGPFPEHLTLLGGGGFLGYHLARTLLARTDAEITVLDRTLQRLTDLSDPRLRRIEGSITDPERLKQALAPGGPVLSLTALCNPALYNTRPREVIDESYTHLVPLVDRCRDERRWLIHCSTCEVYGKPHPAHPRMEEQETPLVMGPVQKQRWTYACAKQLLERLLFAEQTAGLRFTIVRPFNVIGARMDFIPGVDGEGVPRVLACFMQALLRGSPLALVEGGEQRRSFLAVEEFCDAILALLRRPERCQGEVLNLGNPENDISVADLARRMIALFAARHRGDPEHLCERVSSTTFYGDGYDDMAYRVPDITRAGRLLDWTPTISLEQMLPAIVDDYVARYGKQQTTDLM